MKRLTIKDKEIRDNFNAEYAKLADLEDIEEELGIDLITKYKVEKADTVYSKDWGEINIEGYFCRGIYVDGYKCFGNDCLLYSDYGKTWALKKEKLK